MVIRIHIFTAPPLIKQTPYIPINEHNHCVSSVSKQPLKFNHSFYSYKTQTWALSSRVRVGDWGILLPVLIRQTHWSRLHISCSGTCSESLQKQNKMLSSNV